MDKVIWTMNLVFGPPILGRLVDSETPWWANLVLSYLGAFMVVVIASIIFDIVTHWEGYEDGEI